MNFLKTMSSVALCMGLAFGLVACGSNSDNSGHKKSTAHYNIGGTVSGLAGSGLVLQDNGVDDLIINTSGLFTFDTPVANGKDYDVTVLTQPAVPNQTCTVNSGTGTVSGSDVTDITVTCSTTAYTISGTVSGLAGSGLVLQDNGGDDLPVTSNGSFVFNSPVADTAGYSVTVLTSPTNPNQTCTVNSGTGTVSGSDVTDITITCSTTAYTISGTVSGLAGTGLVLQDNGGDDLEIPSNGSFTFDSPVADGADYAVTILTQPSGLNQTCTVGGGTGTVSGSDVTDITITCSTNSYVVGGTVNGLSGSGLVLQNNTRDDLLITGDGSFVFNSPVTDGADYTVTVLTQPNVPNQTCTVGGGTGTVSGADVTNVTVTCATNTYTVGGSVNGLSGSGLVLQNNGGNDLHITGDGLFIFNSPVADGADYVVTVLTQPSVPNQTCTVNNGTGTMSGADVTDITVTCSTNTYTIGGNANGISGSAVLQDNGGDDLTITSDGSFIFDTPVADTGGYAVTILSSTGQTCSISNETGTVSGANVTDVTLSCSPISVEVEARYPLNGADWNGYVKDDGADDFTATDTACDAGTDTACLHGGEMRVLDVPNVFSCAGVTATDALGVFNWVCDDSTSPVRMVSTGLKDGKHLSDLIDFGTPAWKTNSVSVDAGVDSFSTSPAVWWANPVTSAGDGSATLDASGTIYVVTGTAGLAAGFSIFASHVGLVAQPGAIINGPGTNSSVVSAFGVDFLWLEGMVNATGDSRGIQLYFSRFSVLSNVTVENAGSCGIEMASLSNGRISEITALKNQWGVMLNSSSNNILSDIVVSAGGGGVGLSSSDNNRIFNITVSNNGGGVGLNSSSNNVLSNITTSNIAEVGVNIDQGSNNTFTGITASDCGDSGVYMLSTSNNILSDIIASDSGTGVSLGVSQDNIFSNITASNNASGIYLGNTSNNIFSRVTATNNIDKGLDIESLSDFNTFSGIAASNNNYGVFLESLDPGSITIASITASDNNIGLVLNNAGSNYCTGLLKVGNNSSNDCLVWPDIPVSGLVNSTCANNGSSDATLTTGVTLASSFVGKVYNDSVNSSDTGSAVAYPADPTTFDWVNFENQHRAWGLDGTFSDVSSQGQWTLISGYDGAIWDWSVATSDAGDNGSPALLGSLDLPTGDDILVHLWSATSSGECGNIAGATWGGNVCSLPGYTDSGSCTTAGGDWTSDKCYSVFLRNAMEISGDSIGNDNTLCESGEKCLFTPNIGSYQGHGNLVQTGYIGTGGTLTDITLLEYETNGR